MPEEGDGPSDVEGPEEGDEKSKKKGKRGDEKGKSKNRDEKGKEKCRETNMKLHPSQKCFFFETKDEEEYICTNLAEDSDNYQ